MSGSRKGFGEAIRNAGVGSRSKQRQEVHWMDGN